MVERIGRDNLLYARLGQIKLRAIVSPDVKVNRGDIVKLAIRPRRTHLFDSAMVKTCCIKTIGGTYFE